MHFVERVHLIEIWESKSPTLDEILTDGPAGCHRDPWQEGTGVERVQLHRGIPEWTFTEFDPDYGSSFPQTHRDPYNSLCTLFAFCFSCSPSVCIL